MTVADCIFCQIIAGQIPSAKVYEDDDLLVIMDAFPESRGHLLIIPKAHYADIFSMPEDLLNHVMQMSQKIAQAAQSALNADGVKIVQYNGAAAGQTVFHYHMHIVPAYEGVPFSRHAGQPQPIEDLQRLAQQIKDAL